MFKFCPNCTKEIKQGWKCCPYCGFKFDGVGATELEENNAGSALDDALGNLMGLAKDVQKEEQRRAFEDKLRVMIIRGRYGEAKEICNELIDNDPMDKVGYIGLIRIASKNYKEYEGAEIDEQIRVAEEVFFDMDKLLSDPEYSKYITARKQYFEEKERKANEEAERKRKEAEQAEAERQRELARAEAEARKIKELYDIQNGVLVKCKKKDIVNAVIPDGVTSIGECAFMRCSSLESIEIPDSVRSIGDSAFDGCRSLKSIELPDGVTSIEASAFENCSSLKSIKLPDGVTSIEFWTFCECSSLTKIEIPDSVKVILEEAFLGCVSLKQVTVSKYCEIEGNSFPEDCEVHRR